MKISLANIFDVPPGVFLSAFPCVFVKSDYLGEIDLYEWESK